MTRHCQLPLRRDVGVEPQLHRLALDLHAFQFDVASVLATRRDLPLGDSGQFFVVQGIAMWSTFFSIFAVILLAMLYLFSCCVVWECTLSVRFGQLHTPVFFMRVVY